MVGPNASKAFGRAIGDESVRISVIIDRLKATVDRGTADGQLLEPPSSTTVADNEASISAVHAEEIFYDYFQTLLLDARPYSATEARDKIFEVFGIAQKALPPGMAMPLKPNYTSESTTQSLFTSVAALLLEKLPRLSNLSHVEDKCSRRVPNLPSWVPDYTNRLTPIPLTFIRGLNFAFDCCPDNILPEEKHTIERGLLELTGAFFDRVAKVCLPLWEVIKSSDIEPCMKLCLKIREPYLDLKQDAGEVLWRTMIADTHNSQPAAETMGPVFSIWARNRIAIKLTPEIRVIDETGAITSNVRLDEALLRSQLSTLRGLHDASAGKLSLPTVDEVLMSIKQLHRFKLQDFVSQNAILYPNDPFPTGAEQINRLEKDAAAFHFALGPTMPFRRLYLTKKGYLGLGPESMEVDDQVFMLQAARVPFVLREKADSSFELMGETYIHGFMEGRMVAELKVEMGPVHIS
ncbi:hypothetical protein IFR05_002076 [Cadophora sp. M221]|nr:hypothetical protein IFR05_002076 [Cadophora sp. M221]